MSLPACDAVIVQRPGALVEIVAPFVPPAAQLPDAESVTGLPEPPPVALGA